MAEPSAAGTEPPPAPPACLLAGALQPTASDVMTAASAARAYRTRAYRGALTTI